MPPENNHRYYTTIEKALLFIQQQQLEQPALADIAAHCAMSEYHFQRVFKTWAGVSPKRFLQCLTREQCRLRLIKGESLIDSSAGAGLSGAGRLHDLLVNLEAVTPGEIKSGGEHLRILWGVHPTPFGPCFIACTQRGIHQLEFLPWQPCHKEPRNTLRKLREQWPHAEITRDDTHTALPIQQLFAGQPHRDRGPQLTLWLRGSPFQFKVWEALLKIPAGRVCSYGELAAAIGQPAAARAVGSAVAKNPVAILIPCHRVIRNMGVIGNYRWGEIRKQALLGWEGTRRAPSQP